MAEQRITRAVVRVTQSPMNSKRWCLELDCGHDVWVTASRKPKTCREPCVSCEMRAKGSPRG